MRLPRAIWIVPFVVGCVSEEPNALALAVRDSAGVEIIEVNWPDAPALWRVDTAPEWDSGRDLDPADLDLYQVRDAKRVGDQYVVIADGGSRQILRVALGSGTVTRWGGAGDGPQEFRELSRLFDLGNGHVAAYDQARRRLVIFDETGSVTASIGTPVNLLGTLVVRSGDRTDSDFYVADITGLPSNVAQEQRYRGTGAVVRLNDVADTLAVIKGTETFVGPASAGGVAFGATTLLAGAPKGVWIADTKEREVRLAQTLNSVVRIVRWTSDESRVLSDARREAFWQRLEGALPEGERESIEQMRSIVPFADTIPALGDLLVDARGQLWIGSFLEPEVTLLDQPSPAREWLIVDFASALASRITLPEGFSLHQVGEDYVLGVHRDQLGIETVRQYRLRRI